VNCGDSEDIASGRKYRETGFYNVSGVMCEGCDKCIDCPPIKCEPLHPECLRYTRRTDRRGCVLCPYCEVWRNNQRPSPTGSSGFIQVSNWFYIYGSSETLQRISTAAVTV